MLPAALLAVGSVASSPGTFVSSAVCGPHKGAVGYTRMHHWSNKLGVLIMATESGWHAEDFKAPPEGLRQEGVPKGASAKLAAASRRPLTKKAKLCLAGALAVVLALIVGVVSVGATNSGRTPEAAVREYVQLISDGKYDEASKLVDPSSSSSDCKMLSSKTFSGVKGAVKFDSINNFKHDENSDTATVNVVVLVNGRPVKSELQLSKTSRGVNNWKVASPLLVNVQFQGHPYLYSYKIGSVVLDTGYREDVGYGSSISCKMYPGVYNIEGQSVNSEYVEINSVHKQFVAVGMQHGDSYSESDFYASFEFNKHFTVKPTEKLKTWALPQIQSRIKSCASISYPRKDNSCPFETWSPVVRFKALEVKTLPTALYSVAYVNGTSLITARADGVIRMTTTGSTGTSGQEISKTKDFYYNAVGIVDFDKERQPVLKWSVWDV